MEGLASVAYLPVRQLLRELRFDNDSLFAWHFEHKLIQSILLNYFVPGSVPTTCGASRLRASDWGDKRSARERGFIIKSSLGFGSGEANAVDRLPDMQNLPPVGLPPLGSGIPYEERWIAQEYLAISDEYRVHTIETSVIADLTFQRYRPGGIGSLREAPNKYVQEVLGCLPDSLVADTLWGWDVAKVASGEFKVIEINLTGVHPHDLRYQTSGYFVDPDWGCELIARLLRSVQRIYNVRINFNHAATSHSELYRLYSRIHDWKVLLDLADCVREKAETIRYSGSGAQIDGNRSPSLAETIFSKRLDALLLAANKIEY